MPTASVRVRFAPSPTGDPHVGSLRTALFNWLFARHHGGQFIVRIEDTDRERLAAGSLEHILASLAWLGLDVDEGPSVGGPHGPYVQSERLPIYRQHAQRLVESGRAYECFCTSQQLERVRQEQQARKEPSRYDRTCRNLTPDERLVRRSENANPVVRLKVPETGTVSFRDVIRGGLSFALPLIDDAVLLKSDGFPTYHLANVVDDHLMNISHVIRAEEWLPSLPKHLLLYQAFGWTPPQFAHLPLLLGQDRSKLSKRHGAVSFMQFVGQGYLPEALLNFLALLGWNPGGDRELLSRQELVSLFSLDRVQLGGAVFDNAKLDWMNLQYLKRLPPAVYQQRLVEHLSAAFPTIGQASPDWQALLFQTVNDRIKRFDQARELVAFVFSLPAFDPTMLIPKQGSATEALAGLAAAEEALAEVADDGWTLPAITEALGKAVQQAGSSRNVLWPVRVAMTGQRASPPVYESTALVSKAEALKRLAGAHQLLSRLAT